MLGHVFLLEQRGRCLIGGSVLGEGEEEISFGSGALKKTSIKLTKYAVCGVILFAA